MRFLHANDDKFLVAGPGFEPGMLRAYETGVVATLPATDWSGRQESNLRLEYPRLVDYHYPTPRKNLAPSTGIEPA
jgi:hypothetical protein